jgi:hypothetical protein
MVSLVFSWFFFFDYPALVTGGSIDLDARLYRMPDGMSKYMPERIPDRQIECQNIYI